MRVYDEKVNLNYFDVFFIFQKWQEKCFIYGKWNYFEGFGGLFFNKIMNENY